MLCVCIGKPEIKYKLQSPRKLVFIIILCKCNFFSVVITVSNVCTYVCGFILVFVYDVYRTDNLNGSIKCFIIKILSYDNSGQKTILD